MAYTTWAKVVQILPQAADIESVSANQTAIIAAKQDFFHSFLRGQHKADLTGSDEAVSYAVACLVADELMKRRMEDDSELIAVNYRHFTGMVTRFGADAHAIINSILENAIILDEEDASSDVLGPEAVPASGNTSTGTVQTMLPAGYDSDTIDTFLIKITTAGRVDAGTAYFTLYKNYNATALGTAVCSATPVELQNGLYVAFTDGALTGSQFVLNDTWTIRAVPEEKDTRTASPQPIDFYSA